MSVLEDILATASARWPRKTLRYLTEDTRPIQYGVLKPGPFVEGGVPLIRVTDISSNRFDGSHLYRISHGLDQEFVRTRLRGGEILISIQGTIGKVAIVPSEFAGANISRTLAVIDVGTNADVEWVRFWLLLIEQVAEHRTVGATRASLNIAELRKVKVPCPPLPEQRRIAGVLREQMAAVEKARSAAQARLAAVKDLPAAFLRQVFPQPGQSLPDGWCWVKLGEVAEVISGQHILEMDYNPNECGIGYLTGPADFGATKPKITKWTEKPRVICKPMDVLVTVKGAGVGKINLSPDMPVAIGRQLMAIRGHCDSVNTLFLFQFLATCLGHFQGSAMGATVPGLSREDLEMLVFPLPSLPEQQRIAGVLREQMAAVEKARASSEAELNTINTLPAALLRQAFKGEL